VRDLPVASDWASVAAAARETEELRERVSTQIGEIWAARTRREKENIRETILQNRVAFETMLELMRGAIGEPYNVHEDHLGEIYPADLRRHIARNAPLDLSAFGARELDTSDVTLVVRAIIEQFQLLIERNGMWELLYDDDRVTPRRERAAQRFFFALAIAYCEANDLDISPESDAGCGPVDFKVSRGAAAKVIVEVKKSTNNSLVAGYAEQLGAYEGAERPAESHYIVLDVGRFSPQKHRTLMDLRDRTMQEQGRAPMLWFIDAVPQASASRR
jgi:hypothetical protein